MTKHERQAHERMMTDQTKKELLLWMSNPTVQHSLTVRLDLTLKQKRNSELITRRPASTPTVYYREVERVNKFVAEVDAVVPVQQYLIRVDDSNTVNVRVQPSRQTLTAAALTAPFYYLSDNEVRRIAVRMMNRLNQELFKNRARRKNNPERLTALICQHDRGTRRHLHCLFGVPPTVTLAEFSDALHRALKSEPFAYRVEQVEPIKNLAGSIRYNANEKKSLTDDPIVYIYPKRNTFIEPESIGQGHGGSTVGPDCAANVPRAA